MSILFLGAYCPQSFYNFLKERLLKLQTFSTVIKKHRKAVNSDYLRAGTIELLAGLLNKKV